MSSEWMKVMLDEIARKKAEDEQAQIELERRAGEGVLRRAQAQAPAPSEVPGESPRVPPRE